MNLFLAIVQIITESFPISSSAHCLLAQQLFNLTPLTPEILDALHIPTLIMLAVYFRKNWVPILLHPWRYRFCLKNMIIYGFIAEILTVVIYCGLPLVTGNILASPGVTLCGLTITAILLLATRLRCNIQATKEVTWIDVVGIGTAQGIAVIPGISRLGTTYAIGLARGLSARKAFMFSCMLEAPLIAAGGLHGMLKVPHSFWSVVLTPAYAGTLFCAMIIAYCALWLTQYIFEKNYTFIFGIYLIVVVASMVLYL